MVSLFCAASLFLFLDSGNYSRGSKNGSLGLGSAQSNLGFAHSQVRLKQQLLRSKDGNGNCSCRDSDVEFAVPLGQRCDEGQLSTAHTVCLKRLIRTEE
jgi:hypothetical protein